MRAIDMGLQTYQGICSELHTGLKDSIEHKRGYLFRRMLAETMANGRPLTDVSDDGFVLTYQIKRALASTQYWEATYDDAT